MWPAGLHPLVEPSAARTPARANHYVARAVTSAAGFVEKLSAVTAIESRALLVEVFRDDDVAPTNRLDHFARDDLGARGAVLALTLNNFA